MTFAGTKNLQIFISLIMIKESVSLKKDKNHLWKARHKVDFIIFLLTETWPIL